MIEMDKAYYLYVFSLFILSVRCLSLGREDETMMPPDFDNRHSLSENDDCDASLIPVMMDFDMKKFSGEWFELAKSVSGHIDVNDGMWRIENKNGSSTFLFSGRDNNNHCIRPVKGKIHANDQPPGLLSIHYQTYSTHVEENVRVLFTDYTSIAVLYMCVHHIHRGKEACHSAGLMGSIWTREPHVVYEIYEKAARYLEMACVHKSVLIPRNVIGPCKVDDVGFHMDDFPVPDFCYQPKDIGFCRGNLQRFYYDPKLRSCQNFTYHGCGGNRNNFMSLPECHDKCMSISPKDPVCPSIANCAIHCPPCCTVDGIGCVECNCDHETDDKYLGCMKHPTDCEPECLAEEVNPGCYVCSCDEGNEPFLGDPDCLEVREEGHCRDHFERYYYDAEYKECEKFVYTGCEGNKNNFQTLEECNVKCLPTLMKSGEHEGNAATSISCNIWITQSLIILLFVTSKRIS